jgi:predicted PurR-regulated permease PerM
VSEPVRTRSETWLAAIWALLLRIALIAAGLYVLYRLQIVIVVVLIAVMLAFALAPAVDWLTRSPALQWVPRGARRVAAASVVFVALGFGLVQLVAFTINPLQVEVRELFGRWEQYRVEFEGRVTSVRAWFDGLSPEVQEWIRGLHFGDLFARVGEYLQGVVLKSLGSVKLLVEAILVPVLAFSFLTESRPLKREFAIALPRACLRDGLYVLRQTGLILQSYALGQLVLAVIAGVVTWLILTVLGINYALAMSVVAAVTRVIPVIGPLLGGVPIVLLSALQGPDRAVIVLIAFTLMHLIESKVIMPRVIGYRIKLHPAVVIIVLLIGAEFFGMWGMFLAAPVAAVVKALFHYFIVRPRTGQRLLVRPTPAAPTPPAPRKEPQVGRSTVAGAGDHTRAHGVHPRQ